MKRLSRFVFYSTALSIVAVLLVPASARGEEAKALRVACVQMRSGRDLDANVRRTIEHLRSCAAQNAQVAVFPECSLSGYFSDVIPQLTQVQIEAAVAAVAEECGKLKIAAVIGTPLRDGDKLYNSAVIINEQGRIIERYHKVQLAEAWPIGGDHLSVYRLAGVPCTTIICHDERYPELVRLPVLAGARVVFYISHESGLEHESKLGPYRAQIQARAVENGVFIVQSNAPANADLSGSHGQSRLIAPDGNILKEASFFQEEILYAEINLDLATIRNARGSLTRGPLTKWYEEGVRQVRIIE